MNATACRQPEVPRILVAEDDPDQADMLRNCLQDQGYFVDVAFNGDVAFARLLAYEYDLVVLDIHLPGMSGRGVLKAYRARETARHVPIVIVSASASEYQLRRYCEDGADAGLSKPYGLNELLQLTKYVTRDLPERRAQLVQRKP